MAAKINIETGDGKVKGGKTVHALYLGVTSQGQVKY